MGRLREFRLGLSAELVRQNPALMRVAIPLKGWLRVPQLGPDSFPDALQTSFFYPDPPPKGIHFSRGCQSVSHFWGRVNGRSWSVRLYLPERTERRTRPELPIVSVSTFVRLVPYGDEPKRPTPWIVVGGIWSDSFDPNRSPKEPPGRLGGTMILSQVWQAYRLASVQLGRRVSPESHPPVRFPLVAETSTSEGNRYVNSPGFLQAFERWESRVPEARQGHPQGRPVIQAIADRFEFCAGIDLEGPPSTVALTIRELMETVPMFESAFGMPTTSEPVNPVRTIDGPPGSFPIVRPTHPCPKCGEPDLVRRRFEAGIGTRWVSMTCDIDVFRTIPDLPPVANL